MALNLPSTDAVVVGSGPNGLAAAVELARAGLSVVVVEGAQSAGGGVRSAELTLPGFVHDVCSAVHPLGAWSPFLRGLPLGEHGMSWVHPAAPLAHPLDDGSAVVLERSVEGTASVLGPDATAYERLMAPWAELWDTLADDLLRPPHLPRRPLLLARFGALGVRSARSLACRRFRGERARALLAGLAAHSCLPLERAGTAAFALVLGALGHAVGWPVARGGSQRLTDALVACLRGLGGRVVLDSPVESLDELPPAAVALLDVTPRQLLRMAGARLPTRYRRQLARYRYGPGAFKVDWALDGPIPWRAAACGRAGTVHVGGTLEEIAASEREVERGRHPERPFVLLAQQSLFDAARAPAGRHTGWAYCHVPNGSDVDMTERIERQVERFAPGFRRLILARHTRTAAGLEAYNPNCVGGDISGGRQDVRQMLARPVAAAAPYATGVPGLYLCSSSTPPGGGVHGLCGHFAAASALRWLRGGGPAV